MAAKAAPLVRLDAYKRRKLEAQLKSAEIQMSPETYVAAAWVKGGLIGLLVIPVLLIFPIRLRRSLRNTAIRSFPRKCPMPSAAHGKASLTVWPA